MTYMGTDTYDFYRVHRQCPKVPRHRELFIYEGVRTSPCHQVHVASLFKAGQVDKGCSFGLWIRYLGLFLESKSYRASQLSHQTLSSLSDSG